MREAVLQAIRTRFHTLQALCQRVEEGAFAAQLDVAKNKSMNDHLWCLVGGRESYSAAIKNKGWQGFACSLMEFDRDNILAALERSEKDFEAAVSSVDQWAPEQEQMLLDLMEHEVMHEGQIIRLLYGLEMEPHELKWS